MREHIKNAIRAECMNPGFRMDLVDVVEHRKSELGGSIFSWESQFKYYEGKMKTDPSYRTDESVQEYIRAGRGVVKSLKGAVTTCNDILEVIAAIPDC